MTLRISEIPLREEQDVTLARQYARRLSALAGLSVFDQTRFGTAVTVIARNAVQHGGGGQVEFGIEKVAGRQSVQAVIVDRGPGIASIDAILHDSETARTGSGLGIVGAKKLVDLFSIDSRPQAGTIVILSKRTPIDFQSIDAVLAATWADELALETVPSELAINQQQREDLVQALSELRRKEADLKRQLRRISQLNQKLDILSLVASKTDNGVIITDRDGNVEWVNDGFSQMSGYDPFEMFGKKPGQILQGPLTDPLTVQRIHDKLQSKQSFTEEILNYRKDGSTFWVSMNIFPIPDDQGEVVRFIAIEADVTRHRRTEEQLEKAKDAAEALNRAKSEFLANISHEIRTPMNAIIGMSELALDTSLDSEQREYMDTVHDSARSLLRLINDILDYSKIEAGKLTIEPVTFNLRETVQAAFEPLAMRAHEKGLELVVHIPPEIPEALIGDATRLRQIIVNLVENAVKFTDRGEVVVRVAMESSCAEDVCLHFTVTDTGIGLPDDQRQRIFTAFTQADSSTKRRFGGTGLGLAIAARLVEMMHGQIWVESVLGVGSTFHFLVHFNCQQLGSAPPQTPPVILSEGCRPIMRSLRILLAEDVAANRRLASRILERRGHTVLLAKNGAEAVTMFEREPVDLILMDVQMPEMDGFEAAAAIRSCETSTARHTPIVAITAHAMAGDRERCLAAGMDEYAPKPLEALHLIELVESLCATGNEMTTTDGVNGEEKKLSAKSQDKSPAAGKARHDVAQAASDPARDAKTSDVQYDFTPALRRLEGDRQIFCELAGFFKRDSPQILARIAEALDKNDLNALHHAAHSMKGLASNFDAGIANAAGRLERMGVQGISPDARTVFDELSRDVQTLTAALVSFCQL